MVQSKKVQILVLILLLAAAAWWFLGRKSTSQDSGSVTADTTYVSSIAPVSVTDSFKGTNPFEKAKVNPLAGYTNPFKAQ